MLYTLELEKNTGHRKVRIHHQENAYMIYIYIYNYVIMIYYQENDYKQIYNIWTILYLGRPWRPHLNSISDVNTKHTENFNNLFHILSQASSTHCEPLKLKHFHYTTWPDHGVPTHPSSLVKFVQQVRKDYKDSTAPMVVHCRWVW